MALAQTGRVLLGEGRAAQLRRATVENPSAEAAEAAEALTQALRGQVAHQRSAAQVVPVGTVAVARQEPRRVAEAEAEAEAVAVGLSVAQAVPVVP